MIKTLLKYINFKCYFLAAKKLHRKCVKAQRELRYR